MAAPSPVKYIPNKDYQGNRAPAPAPQVAFKDTAPPSPVERATKLSVQAQQYVVNYSRAVLENSKNFTGFYNKMNAIDIAYARFKESTATAETESGVDVVAGNTCCDVFADDDVTPPIVVSQVDSYVAYLAEIFVTGAPLFPVVSSPGKRIWAEQLETLLDDHALIGGYARQFLLMIRDGVKYNFSALECEWDSIDQMLVGGSFATGTGKKIERNPKKFNRIKRLNPRNVVWDWTVAPGDVSEQGDFAGYIERMTQIKFKRLLNKLTAKHTIYNADKVWTQGATSSTQGSPYYRDDPQISHYVPNRISNQSGVDWDSYFGDNNARRGPKMPKGTTYEVFKLYARIMPADFGINSPMPNTPQVWCFYIVNDLMFGAERIISAYDYLPILFGQPQEDGLGYQTQSVAEGEIPFQEAANTLFNIRFAAARRSVSDRALYLADMIKPSDINSPHPAPKIPVHISQLSSKGIDDAYKQIPFDMRGTESTIQDAATIVQFSKDLHGINGPRQGQFQKGNKSVNEWNDTMGGSDGRMRLPAIMYENQVFSPLKSMMTLNIFQHSGDQVITLMNQNTGKETKIDINQLRKQTLAFRLADGYTPKSKLASTEIVMAGMQIIGSSPILQQAYGNRLPGMFAHFMSLSGLKGFEEYDPANMAQAAQDTGLPGNLQDNSIQSTAPVIPPAPAVTAPPQSTEQTPAPNPVP